MYRHEITETGILLIHDIVTRFSSGIYFPEQLDYANPTVKGKLRPVMTQKDRKINWKLDDSDTIIKKIYSSDNQPGVLDTLFDEEYFLYGVHREGKLLGNPGEVIARRQDAICIATINGSVWISHLRKRNTRGEKYFKLPSTKVLEDKIIDVPEYPVDVLYKGGSKKSFFNSISLGKTNTYNEIWYYEESDVGYLIFDFYNGAMDTDKCHMLRNSFISARQRKTKVIVLSCGMDFWSNGIHLNTIEAASDPAEEACRNINAINDLILEIITTDTHLVISSISSSAAAGGLIMAMAADFIYARSGIIMNPHYKSMGLYGSEYWTYLLPRRVGHTKAEELMENCLPIDTEQAHDIFLIDGIIHSDGYDFYHHISQIAENLSRLPDYDMKLRLKSEKILLDESEKPLASYREEEMEEMKKCLYEYDHIYHQCGFNFHTARHNFVHKLNPTTTPLRFAVHRR